MVLLHLWFCCHILVRIDVISEASEQHCSVLFVYAYPGFPEKDPRGDKAETRLKIRKIRSGDFALQVNNACWFKL